MVHPFISAPNFVSVTPSMGVLFPILRRGKVSTLWSLFFLSFMCFANWIFGILSILVNIHLSVSAYHVCSFVTGLPHSGWYALTDKWILSQKLRMPKIEFAKYMKHKKKEDQSVDTSPILRIGNKTPMEGVTETKFGTKTKRCERLREEPLAQASGQ